ncbi:hypothetical protein HanIR_Chr10g0481081 [Helianthus annuus]|nr:hypothetical protein HanIR_Chr10g0481081 [Helianthus annuus]
MEGLIPLFMHVMKRHKLQNSFRSLSAGSYHLLEGSTVEGSSHRRTQSQFQPPTAENLQPWSGFGFVTSQSTSWINKGSIGSTPNTVHASKIKSN